MDDKTTIDKLSGGIADVVKLWMNDDNLASMVQAAELIKHWVLQSFHRLSHHFWVTTG